jgi:Predicted membrane protein
MDKKEFLDTLRNTLAGELPESEIINNISYYEEYITDNETLNQLGDPRLIARTIIDAYKLSKPPYYGRKDNNKDAYEDVEYGYNYERYANQREQQVYEDQNGDEYSHSDKLSVPWYYKILGIMMVIIFLIVAIAVGGIFLNLLFYVVLPIAVVGYIIKTIMHMIQRH